MKKFALLLALLLLLTSCSARSTPAKGPSASSESSSSETASSSTDEEAEKAASEAAAKEAAEKAASEAAAKEAAEKAAAEAAAREAAAKAAASSQEDEPPEQEQPPASDTQADALEQRKAESNQKTSSKKLVSGTNFLSKTEKSIIDLTNEERVANGLEPLVYDIDLHSAARIRSRELCQADSFAHARPDGRAWSTVLDEVELNYQVAGENLSMTEYTDPSNRNNASASFWVNNWINSPSHYENMMKPEYTHIGVGVYSIDKNGKTYAYATTEFAKLP